MNLQQLLCNEAKVTSNITGMYLTTTPVLCTYYVEWNAQTTPLSSSQSLQITKQWNTSNSQCMCEYQWSSCSQDTFTASFNSLTNSCFRSSICAPHNMVNFGPLAAEIGSVVWGTQTNFNGFRVLASLLHGIRAVGTSQTLWRWTEGASYIWQGGNHVGHWPIF